MTTRTPTRVISSYNHDRSKNGWQFEIQESATGRTIHTSDACYRTRAEAEQFGNAFEGALYGNRLSALQQAFASADAQGFAAASAAQGVA